MTHNEFLQEWNNDSPFVEVKTSGSTGTPKHMLIEKKRMLASARTTCDFLGLREGDSALLCMPLDYIAGKMMVVRSIERRLKLTVVKPSLHPLAGMTEPFDFIAMVPSQVFETLKVPTEAELLLQSRNVIIGGGAITPELKKLINISLPIGEGRGGAGFYSTYGMTETLSHIALRRIQDDWYTPFDGIQVSLNQDNCLVINAPAICQDTIVTNDIAEIRDGKFRILGRKDNVICSGGIKIQAEEVEALLEPHLPHPFLITKKKDPRFGEVVVLITESTNLSEIKQICQPHLPRYWQPKEYLHIDKLPMTETGKKKRNLAISTIDTNDK